MGDKMHTVCNLEKTYSKEKGALDFQSLLCDVPSAAHAAAVLGKE